MPVPDTSGVPPFADFEDLKRKINEIVQKYNNLLVNLDTLNVVSLNAEVIVAGSITGDKIAANTITADKMQVNELSAITANLGHITAGLIEAVQIFGSYIATSQGFPRIEFSSADDLLVAYGDANNYIYMRPQDSGAPTIGAFAGGDRSLLMQGLIGAVLIAAMTGNLTLQADTDINLNPLSGDVTVPSWERFYSNGDNESLQDALDNLQSQINSLDARVTALGG